MADAAAQHSTSFRILRNAVSILLGDVGGEILTTYAIGLAALSLGPSGFGTLSEAQAFMDPFDVAAGFGLTQVAITVAARQRGCDGTLRGTIFVLRAAFALVAVLGVNLAAVATGRTNLSPVIAVISVGALFTPLSASSSLPFQFNQAMHRVVLLPFLASVVRLSTAYLALYYDNAPVGYQLSVCAAGFTSMVLYALAARRFYPVELKFDAVLAKAILRVAWPAAALEVIVTLYSRASYFLLHSAGSGVQGEFAAAERLLRPLFGVASALFASSLPTLAVIAAAGNFRLIAQMYARSIGRLVLVIVPVIGSAWLAMPWLLARFVPAYAGAVPPFRWLAVGAVFMLLNQMSTTFVVAMGRFRAIMMIAMINFAVYLALASYLVPRYHATGAAAATTVMEGINTMLQLAMVYWLLRGSARSMS